MVLENIVNVLFDNDKFNFLCNIFIGLTALIISLSIFSLDKTNIDDRKIFKMMLIEESRVKDLFMLIIINFFLIIIQVFLSNYTIIIYYLRQTIIIIIIYIIIKMIFSIFRVINILQNEYIKTKLINKKLNKIINYYSKNILCMKNKDLNKKLTIYSSFLNDNVELPDHEYEIRYLKNLGVFIKINKKKLKLINKKISKIISRDKITLSDEEKKQIILFDNSLGNTNSSVLPIFIDNRFSEIETNNIYVTKLYDKNLGYIIKHYILDVFQNYTNNIVSSNIFNIDTQEYDIFLLYPEIYTKLNSFSDFYFDCINNLYSNSTIAIKDYNNVLFRSIKTLCYKSVEFNDDKGFKTSLSLYYNFIYNYDNNDKLNQII